MNTNATQEQLYSALQTVNENYNGNIQFRRLDQQSANRRMFTLRVEDSSGAGARRAASGRRTVSACWHVHGEFFEALLKQDENIFIRSNGRRIDKHGGNWEEINIGSEFMPVYMSTLCDC